MKTYAQHRRIIDADSHLMELDDFLHNAARPEHLDLVPSMHDQKSLPVHKEGLEKGRALLARRQQEPETMAKFEASMMDNTKSGWSRIGAFDPARALPHARFARLRAADGAAYLYVTPNAPCHHR